MRAFFAVLCLLALSSGAYAEEYYAVGSKCSPTTPATEETPGRDTVCVVWELPTTLKLKPHANEIVPFKVKVDRLVPARPVTVGAAPK